MPWNVIQTSDITSRFTLAETNMLQSAQGATTQLGVWLTTVINEWRDAINATGFRVSSTANAVPDQFRRHVIALTVWCWLRDFPKLDVFKTQERKDAAADAERIYEKICNKTYGSIADPFGTDTSTANWNSQPRVQGRMMPVPLPVAQIQTVPTQLYANPNAPADTVPTNDPGIPLTPRGFTLVPGNAQVTIQFDPVTTATSYNIYRSTTSLQEMLLVNVTTTTYTDSGLVNGTNYFYQVSAVNSLGISPRSQELLTQPQASLT